MKNFLLFVALAAGIAANAQLNTETASITFHSEIGDITATNSKVASSLDNKTGALTFKLKISQFIFENSTMQEHFNQEGVMDSDNFPAANFEGKITNNTAVDYTADGSYDVTVNGKLTIKGVTKELEVSGKIVVKNGKISAQSSFELDRFEYGVDGKKENVSQVLSLRVNAKY